MSAKLIDIALLIGSGRVNWDVEAACFEVVGAEGMADFARKMRSASGEQVVAVWRLVKATPSGMQLK